MSTNAEERQPATYVTARFADGKKVNGDPYKNVLNLFFHGGYDTRGMPILSNPDEKTIAFVDVKNGKLALRHTDAEGVPLKDGDQLCKPYLSIGLARFTNGDTTDPKTLEIGQGAVTGPKRAELIAAFDKVLSVAIERKSAAKPSAPGM